VLDSAHFAMVKSAVSLRMRHTPYILSLARAAAADGEPIVRSLEYAFPHQGYRDVRDQFMLGDRLLVAPVLARGAVSRVVQLPPGRWRGSDGTVMHGPRRVEVRAAIEELPYFERVPE
jgi:alpha-glucosidase (family GH31 glycosyl hydrolase)